MRTSFWRGVIAGGIIGAAISMMLGERQGHISKVMAGNGAKEVKSRAHKVIRGVAKSVNDMVK